jgi:outer membrane protein assembly factor BamB
MENMYIFILVHTVCNVIMCKDGGILTCVDANNGAIVYRERIGAAGSFIASPVEANGYIYLTSAKGVITVVKAGDKLEIVKQSNLKENVFATPAIVENSVYIRAQNHLYAYR